MANNRKNRNINIELLRTFLSLWIVILHCSKISKKAKRYILKGFHVPTFFLLSFYFYYPILSQRLTTKIISRFQRILVPYIFWPIITLLLNNFLLMIASKGIYKGKGILTLKDIYIQFLFGTGYHWIFWFQFNLIFVSLFFTIISFMFKNYFLIILHYFGLICLYLNYSHIIYNYLFPFRHHLKIPLGCLLEMIPLAVIGCDYNSIKLLLKMKEIPLHNQIILLVLLYFLFKYDFDINILGFRYPLVLLNIMASTTLLILFNSLKIDKLLFLNPIIIIITKFTGGIYYVHIVFRDFLRNNFYFFSKTLASGFVIYFLCYIICFIGYSFFRNNKMKYLFI